MKRTLLLATGFAAVALSGAVHGLWTDRWHPSAEALAAAERITAVPSRIGDWQGQDLELDPEMLEIADVSGHLARRYVNGRSGDAVNVLLVCGRPGPVSVHTPEACLPGAGYQLVSPAELHSLEAPGETGPSVFRVGRFAKPGPAGRKQHLRTWWTWSATGDWLAPERPRVAFGYRASLYRLTVSRGAARADESFDTDPCAELLRLLLPELRRTLFPTP